MRTHVNDSGELVPITQTFGDVRAAVQQRDLGYLDWACIEVAERRQVYEYLLGCTDEVLATGVQLWCRRKKPNSSVFWGTTTNDAVPVHRLSSVKRGIEFALYFLSHEMVRGSLEYELGDFLDVKEAELAEQIPGAPPYQARVERDWTGKRDRNDQLDLLRSTRGGGLDPACALWSFVMSLTAATPGERAFNLAHAASRWPVETGELEASLASFLHVDRTWVGEFGAWYVRTQARCEIFERL